MKKLQIQGATPWRVALMLLAFCAATAQGAELEGRVWDVKAQSFISIEAALGTVVVHPVVLLGEVHDSTYHHALQLQVLEALQKSGRKPVLAMEQLDQENQAAIDAALALPELATLPPVDAAERVADLGKLNKKGWRWPMYRDLLAFALQHKWSVSGANLSRKQGRDIAMGTLSVAVPELPASAINAIETDLIEGHCGQRPTYLAALVTAQRARDATMAKVIEPSVPQGVVLIAGAGHVRRDRAVPSYLSPASAAQAISIAFTEVEAAKKDPKDYDAQGFDLLWFTPATPREDPCAKPLGGSVAPNR